MTAALEDLSWRRLYRAGAWASLAYVILVLVPLALLFLAPLPPASGAAVLEYIQANQVVYIVELVCFVGLSIPAIVVFCAWAVALWSVDRSLALIGGVFGVGSEITALAVGSSPQSLNGGLLVLSDSYHSASTAQQRAGLAGAADAIVATTNAMPWAGVLTAAGILLLSLAMRRGPFPPTLAMFSTVTGVVGVISEALRPVLESAYLLYGLLLPTWFVVTGWRLWTLAREHSRP
jgi:hypothetical protein